MRLPSWIALCLVLGLMPFPIVAGRAVAGASKLLPPAGPATATWAGPRPPWRRRRRHKIVMRAKGQGLLDLSRWPKEPRAPKSLDRHRFASALRELCGWMPPKRPHRYAGWIIDYGKRFAVDPFLLGALIYRQSLCIPTQQGDYGLGLSAINEGMHRGHIKRRRYHYFVFDNGRWQPRSKDMGAYLFFGANLRRSRPNIYFAAALLSIYREQWPHLGKAFGSVPYRHYVSHFIWGDRVRDAGPEDRVLRARRRLLEYYAGPKGTARATARGKFGAVALGSPLDGTPRKVTSGLGDERQDGVRRHKGIDFSSTFNEPVRAIADGKVIIAGIDARRGPSRNMSCADALKVKSAALGPGGLYVMIRHAGGLASAYMHLSRYDVEAGAVVKRGQLIGRVGRSGIKSSAAHLHFEMRHQGKHLDPIPYLEPYLFGPQTTYLGRKLRYERQRRRRRQRLAAWRARKRKASPTPPAGTSKKPVKNAESTR